jgi:uncharacterized protein
VATYFLDTSAIVKRYFPEQGHTWIVTLCDPAQGHTLSISQAALVEVVATMCRKAREQRITISERNQLIDTFRQDLQETYSVRIVTTAMYTAAGDLCRSHPLRAYDAVQLACALDLGNEMLAHHMVGPIFVCADSNLLRVAATEGLNIENPQSYP